MMSGMSDRLSRAEPGRRKGVACQFLRFRRICRASLRTLDDIKHYGADRTKALDLELRYRVDDGWRAHGVAD